MGWDAMVFGELRFPAGGVDAWKRLRIEPGLYADWSSSSYLGDAPEAMTVHELLVKLEDHARWCETYAGIDHQRSVVTADRVTVRAHLNEDDFRYWQGLIATMMRLGEKAGASGEYVAMASDDLEAERVTVSPGHSAFEHINLVDDGDYSAIVEAIAADTMAKLQRMRGATTPPHEPAPKKPAPKKPASKKSPRKRPAPKKPARKKPARKKSR